MATYGWLLGGALLIVGCLLTLCTSLLLCYCIDKWTKVHQQRRRHRKHAGRGAGVGSGEYERVDSVSSFVSSVASHRDYDGGGGVTDDQLESVSMI